MKNEMGGAASQTGKISTSTLMEKLNGKQLLLGLDVDVTIFKWILKKQDVRVA